MSNEKTHLLQLREAIEAAVGAPIPQAQFARVLNITPAYFGQLARGEHRPGGKFCRSFAIDMQLKEIDGVALLNGLMPQEHFDTLLPALVARGKELLRQSGGIANAESNGASAHDRGAPAAGVACAATRDRAAFAQKPGRGVPVGKRQVAAAVELGAVDAGLRD